MTEKRFVNPYNFIPLPKQGPVRGPVSKGDLTGVIRYSLVTRTPLIIPNTSNDHAFDVKDQDGKPVADHKSYDFFSYDDLSGDGISDERRKGLFNEKGTREGKYSEPVIPGSEIRGMLRNYYEILTNSCMSFVDDDDVLSKRTAESFKAGLLERTIDEEGKALFILHTATDCLLRGDGDKESGYEALYRSEEYHEGQRVYFKRITRQGRVNGRFIKAKPLAVNVQNLRYDGSMVGYIIKGEAGPEFSGKDKYKEKHNIHVFIDGNVVKTLSNSEVNTLSTVLKIYKGNKESGYNEYSAAWKSFYIGEGEDRFPVYYSRVNDDADIMLSPASITREIYSNKLHKLLRDHYSCSDSSKLCPACALFGMMNVKSRARSVSRLRIADLYLEGESASKYRDDNDSVYDEEVTLSPLNAPKINNMEFYVKRPAANAWFWTYDYYVDDKGRAHLYTPEINGRKFYWHQPDMKPVTGIEPSNLNSTVRPVATGITFSGAVYFDHLTETELDELVYLINAGDKDDIKDKASCYKLGHGKPLGYGSIAMHVDSVEVRKAELDKECGSVKYSVGRYTSDDPELDSDIVSNFNVMTDFNKLRGLDVHYPLPDRSDDNGEYPIFKWFVENHGGYDHKKEKTVDMPNSRLSMTYRQYMTALEPELKETGAPAGSKGRHKWPSGGHSPAKGPAIQAVVKRSTRSGGIIIDDNGKEGMITAKKLGGRQFRSGDIINARFSNEKTFDDGHTVRFYDIV